MFKLVKYEYRRNLGFIVAMVSAILGAQAYFLCAAALKNVDNMVIAGVILFLLAVASGFGVLLYSVSLYSRELNAKTSYLTFMTPITPARILGSKLLATFVLGVAMVALLCGFAVWDFSYVLKLFPAIDPMRAMVDQFLAYIQTSVNDVLTAMAVFSLEFLSGFFATVVLAYLAITLSATILQNKRSKGVVSVVLFLVLTVLVQRLAFLVTFGVAADLHSPRAYLFSMWPTFAVYIATIVVAFIASVRLLKKHVSL